tara:strand:+ start:274 stop:567 length:294 start_codon:yes stop_codon:yes gene_type:complete
MERLVRATKFPPGAKTTPREIFMEVLSCSRSAADRARLRHKTSVLYLFIYLFIYFITTMCFNIHENICDPENYASFNRSQSAWMSLYNERGRGRFRR